VKAPPAEVAVRTDPGRDPDKQVNEDSSVTKETPHGLLAVVCDGMGGHAGGKEASELAIRTIIEVIDAAPAATSPSAALKRAIEEANTRVFAMPTAEAGFRPGSTVVAALVHEGGAEIAHVGDSRLYLVHAGAISQVTRDHSMVQEMVDRNLIRAEDAAKHPDANKILRALGIGKDVEVDVRPEPLVYSAGDVFVLCSDGLSDLVEPAEILQIAGSQPVAQAAGQLVDLANARGGHDNITAIVVLLRAGATPRASDGRTWTGPKTIPLTAHEMPPDANANANVAGRTGTVLSPPAGSPGVAPTAPGSGPVRFGPPPTGQVPIAIPPAPPSSQGPGSVARRSSGTLVLGILLAIVAVGVLGALVWVASHPKKRAVVPLIVVAHDAGPEDTDASMETPVPTFVPAPPLSASGSHWDGGASDPCGAVKRARDRDASAATIDKLTQKCLDAGGVP
jgi:serine/threonine protein phosphatase PrpC